MEPTGTISTHTDGAIRRPTSNAVVSRRRPAVRVQLRAYSVSEGVMTAPTFAPFRASMKT